MTGLGVALLHALTTAGVALVASAVAVGCDGDASGVGNDTTKPLTMEALQLRVPTSWSVRRLPVECGCLGPGVLVTNVENHSFERDDDDLSPESCTSAWKLQGVPRDFVLVDMSRFTCPRPPPPVGAAPLTDSHFPLTFSTFIRENVACRCTFLSGYALLDGFDYNVRAWIGDDASASDQLTLDALLRSIRPKRS